MTNRYQEREDKCNRIARQMLIEHDIKEVTTRRQALNGTREFEFPIPAYSCKVNGELRQSSHKLRVASFKSGYVRNQNGCLGRAYQINKVYKQEVRYTILRGTELVTSKYHCPSRQLIIDPVARLIYILDYYFKKQAKYKALLTKQK